MRAVFEKRKEWFGDWPVKRNSLGGRLENFIFCKGEHLTILTESFLYELCADAGFVNTRTLPPRQTDFPKVFGGEVLETEYESDELMPHTLIIEAEKP